MQWYRKSIKSIRSRRASRQVNPITSDDTIEEEKTEQDNPSISNEKELLLANNPSVVGDVSRFGKPSNDSVVRLLVENGADVNAVDVYDLTPLHYACMRGNDVAIRDLLSYPQVLIEETDKQNMTPLFLAATFGYADAVTQLLISGANIFVRDEEYQTPLHRAAAEGHKEIVHLLLSVCKKRGDGDLLHNLILARNSERMTALYQAVANGHYQVTNYYLK
ncbi:hypothetical protein HAZT_HAZT003625 [Hyalella azteca]|uniref:Uncharacterized protein n=1 Tax=Hyalella azteca TaxID=294128 RepID=A0A6A0GU78_HYAAZ|nr:hypothetical protein HAZT_HAZT003625 [Hyalella azteca]